MRGLETKLDVEMSRRRKVFLGIVGLAVIVTLFIVVIGGMVDSVKNTGGDGELRALLEFFDALSTAHTLMWGGFLGSLPIACYSLNVFGCRRNQGLMQLAIAVLWLGVGATWGLTILANPQSEGVCRVLGFYNPDVRRLLFWYVLVGTPFGIAHDIWLISALYDVARGLFGIEPHFPNRFIRLDPSAYFWVRIIWFGIGVVSVLRLVL